jgi:hypothetical protein
MAPKLWRLEICMSHFNVCDGKGYGPDFMITIYSGSWLFPCLRSSERKGTCSWNATGDFSFGQTVVGSPLLCHRLPGCMQYEL